MKAISIKEPYASMIRRGEKLIETRTWKTDYRGDLLLCASQKPESDISGKAFAVAKLADCVPMTTEHEAQAGCKVYPGAYAWILRDVTAIMVFPVKGQLSLFEVDVPLRLKHG